MPRAGLSLLGFMDQNNALNYLRSWCVPVDDSDVALIAEWHAARAARGNPTPILTCSLSPQRTRMFND